MWQIYKFIISSVNFVHTGNQILYHTYHDNNCNYNIRHCKCQRKHIQMCWNKQHFPAVQFSACGILLAIVDILWYVDILFLMFHTIFKFILLLIMATHACSYCMQACIFKFRTFSDGYDYDQNCDRHTYSCKQDSHWKINPDEHSIRLFLLSCL